MYATDHQKRLLNFFSENKDASFSATELVGIFKNEMNKATIYRKLKSMVDNKLIKKIFNPLKQNMEYQYLCQCSHLHLICQSCKKIIHLDCVKAHEFISHIFLAHQFSINQINTSIYGLCKECQNA